MLTYFGRGPRGQGTQMAGQGSVQAVRGYWEALREQGGVPRRDRIDPRGLADHLDKVFLVERIAKGQARFRLAGMHLNDMLGMDVRGMPLSSLFEPVARTKLAAELEQVFDAPSILEIWLEAERGTGRPALSGRMLLLPLVGSAGEPDLALGCFVTEGAIGRQPRRFAVSGMVREMLVMPRLRVLPAAAAQIVELPRPPRAAGKPALRLVSSRE